MSWVRKNLVKIAEEKTVPNSAHSARSVVIFDRRSKYAGN